MSTVEKRRKILKRWIVGRQERDTYTLRSKEGFWDELYLIVLKALRKDERLNY